MYAITHRGLEGQPGLYARVQRKADSYWWDEVGTAWIAAATTDCDLALTEGDAGTYTASGSSSPSEGGLYIIYVYDSADAQIVSTEDIYSPSRGKTALDMVKNVQKELRMPQAVTIAEAHASLILSFLNKTQDIIMEAGVLDELKLSFSFNTVVGISAYTLYPSNTSKVDTLRHLQIGTSQPLVRYPDKDFRAYKRNQGTTQAQPLIYRIYGRAGRALVVELAATPDAIYTVDVELLQKPERLISGTDVSLLDGDVLELGAKYLALDNQGDSAGLDQSLFQAKLGLSMGTNSESNWGDVEAI